MRGLLVNPSGDVTAIEELSGRVLQQFLGEKYLTIKSDDKTATFYIHELWLVADLPLNVHASKKAGVVLGGPVVIAPHPDPKTENELSINSFYGSILKQNTDENLLARLEALYRKNHDRLNFKLYEDRWLLNSKTFDAIVVAESDDHLERGIPKYMVWFFSKERKEPFRLKIVEYSLREVMEAMILDDEKTFNGHPPDHFRTILEYFGR